VPLNLAIEARDMRWDRFAAKIAETGSIVEEWIAAEGLRSPSVQLRITPVGGLEIISTHDQILGGPSGQVFQACTFPADPAYAREIQLCALKVGEVLKARGVLGRFGIDFVSVPHETGWRHYAIEINLRKGGATRSYYATDNVVNAAYRRLTPDDLIDVTDRHDLHFDPARQCGVVFNLIGALSECGKIGVVAIDEDRERAQSLFRDTVRVLDEEAARG
jgi:hypothetical protein